MRPSEIWTRATSHPRSVGAGATAVRSRRPQPRPPRLLCLGLAGRIGCGRERSHRVASLRWKGSTTSSSSAPVVRHARSHRSLRRRGGRPHLEDPSHAQPPRAAAEGGINAALGNASEDDPEKHAFDTVKGSTTSAIRTRSRPLQRGPGRRLRAGELGRRLLAHRGRSHRPAALRRRRRAPHRLRGRHHGSRARARPLRAGDEARHRDLRGVVRLEARRGRRALPGRHLLGSPERRPEARRGEDGDPGYRRGRPASRGRRTPTPAPATAWRWRACMGVP